MKRDGAELRPLDAASLQWRNARTPLSAKFDDVYFSAQDGLAESQYTFLAGNGIPRRWQTHAEPHFCAAETGFGSGLNFLLTWQAWNEHKGPTPDLHFVSVERFPLRKADLQQALTAWPTLAPLATQLLQEYPPALPGCHRLLFAAGRVRLDLHFGDAREVLAGLAGRQAGLVDAWYLDGFAPARNAAMWSQPLMHSVATLSREGATFATFTAAGNVRRALQQAGFAVHKATGFGGKREALRGHLPTPPPSSGEDGPLETPWDIPDHAATPVPGHVLVLGAGLAGCHVASALARRGIRVTVLDRGGIADGASGNTRGVLYTRLSRRHSTLVDFALLSYRFAQRCYANMLAGGDLQSGVDGELCGCYQTSGQSRDLAALAVSLRGLEEFAQVLDTQAASDIVGLTQTQGGYWFAGSGWLDPRAVCRALLAEDAIEVRTECGPLELVQQGACWQACAAGEVIAKADAAVVATGSDTGAIAQTAWLPLRKVRGQTTELPATESLRALRTVYCHAGYITPARLGSHCIGATFDMDDADCRVRHADHASNLSQLAGALPESGQELAAFDPATLSGRAAVRCASQDYLPVVGAVPDVPAFTAAYRGLQQNARRHIDHAAPCLPGLYVTSAHGSRGLTSTPLAAQILASMICNEPLPLERSLSRALAPARFLVRDIIRGRL